MFQFILGKNTTKHILFSKTKHSPKLHISYWVHIIKQYHTVECLGCHLDFNLSGESIAMKVLKKVNAKVKFLYRQNKYLTPRLKILLCNALIHRHFDKD